MKRCIAGFFLFCLFFPKAQVSIKLNIFPFGENHEAKIEVDINKGAVSNFAKYQMELPSGVGISSEDIGAASFSFENNRAKIIWVALPLEPRFTIKMKLNTGKRTGSGIIKHKFYYLDGNSKKELALPTITVNYTSDSGISVLGSSSSETTAPEFNSSASASNLDSSSKPEKLPVANKSTNVESKSDLILNKNSAATDIKTLDESISNTADAYKAVGAPTGALVTTFRVQIGAFKEKPNGSVYKGLNTIRINKEDNLYKVYSGDFKNKEDALSLKTELKAKGFVGFVVAFQNGVRLN